MSHLQRISWSCKIWGEIIQKGDYFWNDYACTPDQGVTWAPLSYMMKCGNFSAFLFACTKEEHVRAIKLFIFTHTGSSFPFYLDHRTCSLTIHKNILNLLMTAKWRNKTDCCSPCVGVSIYIFKYMHVCMYVYVNQNTFVFGMQT